MTYIKRIGCDIHIITIVLGSQGSGKTLYLVKKGYEAYKKGLKVYSNFHLTFPHELLTYDQMIRCELKNCVVLCDEAHVYGFDARSSMSKGNLELVKTFVTQMRKNFVFGYFSSQRSRQLDVRLRANSDFALFCKKYSFDVKNKSIHEVTQSQQFKKDLPIIVKVDIVKGDDGSSSSIYFHANPYYKLYDTSQVIKLSQSEKDKSLYTDEENESRKKRKKKEYKAEDTQIQRYKKDKVKKKKK